jgi:hypothetical protein
MRLMPQKTISRFLGGLTGLLIVLGSSTVIAQTQPATPPLPALPRLTLTAQDEHVIRENLLNDTNRPRQRSEPDNIGDVVPQNNKLQPLPPEIMQKSAEGEGASVFHEGPVTSALLLQT